MPKNDDRKQEAQKQIRDAFENPISVEHIPPTIQPTDQQNDDIIIRVAPYCRVSTDTIDQLKSYELQVQSYKDSVTKNPHWELVDIYADPGISGTSLKKREQFLRMIEDCKAGKIDLIITKSISRFARNVVDCVETARLLKSLTPPVGILFEDVGINTLTQTGELLMVVLAAIAQGESETKSTSIKWGFQKRFEAGIPKIAPLYGYRKEGRDLFIQEQEANIVRLIYHMFSDGIPISSICRTLNSQNILSPKETNWTYSTVRNILENEKYCGDVLMQKTVSVDLFSHKTIKNDGRAWQHKLSDHHSAIIERDLWEYVQEKLKRKERQNNRYWICETESVLTLSKPFLMLQFGDKEEL